MTIIEEHLISIWSLRIERAVMKLIFFTRTKGFIFDNQNTVFDLSFVQVCNVVLLMSISSRSSVSNLRTSRHVTCSTKLANDRESAFTRVT